MYLHSRILSLVLLLAGFLAIQGAFAQATAPSPDTAMQMLKDGNHRFASEARVMPNLDATRRQTVAKEGQKPYATILTCSDSRVPPEHIFDAGLGDLFVVRVAGNVADTDEIGTIEYGVEHLKTPFVLVMGHSNCGAVTAVVKGDKVEGSIPALVSKILPAAAEARKEHPGATDADLIAATIELNVWQSIHDLLTRSPLTAELVREGKVKVVGALYDLASGEVRWLGEYPEQAALLAASTTSAAGEGSALSWARPISVAALACLIFLVAFLALVSRSLRFKRMKARTRLLLCSLVTIGVLIGSAISTLRAMHASTPVASSMQIVLLAGVPAVMGLLFSIGYINAVSRSFHDHVEALKAQIQ